MFFRPVSPQSADGPPWTKLPARLESTDTWVSLSGRFLDLHGEEILGLARNEESRKKAEHALERIMQINQRKGETVITTTDIHLARRIGEAVHHAYASELDYHYGEAENRLQVNWKRDE